ncbi:hypothetical protein PP1_008365 [Pseudonocardia sp. P1]|nr:hypothetical protein [Pseudonocardia sp. Ae707_Ps1]
MRLDIDGLRRRRADVAFTRWKVAVFVDGCFRHRRPDHATIPRSDQEWWAKKLADDEP